MISVPEWLKTIEMKKFVDDGICLQMKIILTTCQKKEYFNYKNKWWLHSNKSGSDTLPLRKRSEFKQALSTLERLHQEAGGEQFAPTYSYKHKQWQSAQSSSSTWWKWQDSWWSSWKIRRSRKRGAKSWEGTGRPVINSTLAKNSEDGFQEFNLFCYRWIVYSWRRSTVTDGECKDHTSNDSFSRCAASNNYGYSSNWRWQDKVGLQHQEDNLDYVRVVKPSDKTSDTNDDVTTKTNTVHMKRDTWQVSVHVVFLLVLFSLASSSSLIAHHIVAQVVRASHLIHACSERYSSTLSSPFHPTSSSSHSPSISRSPCCCSSNTVYSTKKGDGVCWRVLPPHRLWAQELRPHGDLCRVPHRVPDPATVPWATVPRGCGLRWHRARGDAT